MSDQPTTISEAAREAARQEINNPPLPLSLRPLGQFVQLAITAATAPLTQENERLKERIATDFMSGVVIEKEAEILSLQKQITGLRAALRANGIFHTPIALRKNGASWDEYQLDAISRTNHALSTPDFSKQFVKREVAERLLKLVRGQFSTQAEVDEALNLAKAELEGGK